MKKIKVDVGESTFAEFFKEPVELIVDDNANTFEIIAALDEHILKLPVRPKKYSWGANTIMQVLWDVKKWDYFEDVGVDAHGPNSEWLPARNKPFDPIPANSSIIFWPDSGC
ncbi:MAG: hypothetical protein ACTSRZ_04780 [Promethearchaeota archaeon]